MKLRLYLKYGSRRATILGCGPQSLTTPDALLPARMKSWLRLWNSNRRFRGASVEPSFYEQKRGAVTAVKISEQRITARISVFIVISRFGTDAKRLLPVQGLPLGKPSSPHTSRSEES